MEILSSTPDLNALVEATRSFNPERLTLAREAAGIDIKVLAGRVDTTPSAISQFESTKHRTKPKAETLIRLSLALGVPLRFFGGTAPPSISLEQCHFRRRRGASMREQRYVLARGKMVREVTEYLETIIQFPNDTISPLCRTAADISEIEQLAQDVRDIWKLGSGPISDVVALLERHGALPVEVQARSERLDAFSTWVESQPMVFLSTDKESASRRRFDAAHELGHLLMHDHASPGDTVVERQADAFASAFLLPRVPFLAECPPQLSWPRLREVKRRWGVSLLALVRRAYDLELYSEASYRRAHVQYNQHGWREGEPDEPQMEHPTLLARAIDQLTEAGQPILQTASDLNFSTRLLESIVWPEGRTGT